MPALIHFGRKWLAACDDLVIPYAIEASLRIIWLCASSVMLYLDFTDTASSIYVRYFLYAFIGELFLTLCLSIGISVISSKGSVLQPQKRTKVAGILYLKLFTVLFDAAIASYLTWLLNNGSCLPQRWTVFCEAAAVCVWGYVLAACIVFVIVYNPLGSPKYWNSSNTITSLQIFKKAEKIWRLRLKFFCCCADVSEEEIYVEIATFLATFSSDIDLAPTDILAGLVILTGKHAIERRKKNQPRTLLENSLIENKLSPLWMTAENALYYLRIAKSTYGWLAFFNSLRPWKLCSLLTTKCCTSFSNNTKHGDCCNCNASAFEKISGLSDSDVLYASFSSSIHEPAFVATLHHEMKSVVIAIRGTRSFSDLITDIDAEEMNFPGAPELKCHRGALRSALFIHRRLQELNLLPTVFSENPSYTLVLTGHSLGGSIAAILGLLLRPQYPSLQCYSYAPLAALSSEGVSKTIDFVFSVVVGDDITPCLSVYSCKNLLRQLYKSLEETQVPKYKLLTRAFKHYVKQSLKRSSKAKSRCEGHQNMQVEVEEEPIQFVAIDMNPTHEAQLFAPGRILHLKRNESGVDFCWESGFDLQNITISLHMMKDHQPHHIQQMLEKFKSTWEENCKTRL